METNPNLNPNQMQLKVNINDASDLICVKCSGMIFQAGFMFKKLSALQTGGDKPTLIPIAIYRCMDCGEIPMEFFPKFKKENDTPKLDLGNAKI